MTSFAEGPYGGFQDILPLELVQFRLFSDVGWKQSVQIIWVKRSCTWWILNIELAQNSFTLSMTFFA